MPTIEERETLLKRTNPPRSGFTPRPVQKLATQRRPRDMLSIECNHVIRVSTEENTHSIPVLAYLMWQEAGKHRPPDNPDPAYNSNVWRNFRQQYGIPRRSKGEKINRMIAEMYPMAIPPASKVGTNTYSKFLLESDIVKNPKHYQVALQQATRDTEELHRMRLHSDLRCPPLDEDGNVLAPHNFKRYEHRFVPPTPPSQDDTDQTKLRQDIFGQLVPESKRQPYLWKLRYRINHPDFNTMTKQRQSQEPPRFPGFSVSAAGNQT